MKFTKFTLLILGLVIVFAMNLSAQDNKAEEIMKEAHLNNFYTVDWLLKLRRWP